MAGRQGTDRGRARATRIRPIVAASVVLVLGIAMTPVAAQAPERDHQPVLIRGALLPGLEGESLDRIRVFRHVQGTGFEPMPHQIDERVAHVFNPGSPMEFVETIYDVFGEDDGSLDADDEIAVLFGDAGERAPYDAPWPEGADAERLEIEIRDPRTGAPVPSRWVYVFTGDALPTSPSTYVDWNLLPSGVMRSDALELTFEDRWLLTEFRVPAPCGTGEDLIDRFKGRATTHEGNQEDEEGWNLNSTYMGGLTGPVRAIRYVRGATSGVNTVHHDVVYRNWWRRTVNLRVHPLADVRVYLDLLSIPGTTFYSPFAPDGVPVDGVPDAIPATHVGWSLVSGPAGGFVTAFDVAPGPVYGTRYTHYVDDATVDDCTPLNPHYEDDDHAAYGAHGIGVTDLGDTNLSAAVLRMTVESLCSNEGDAALGQAHRTIQDAPFGFSVLPQTEGFGPVRSLTATREGHDVVLDWQDVAGASSYRVYRATDPSLPSEGWTLASEVTASEYRDVGGVGLPTPRHYTVVPVDTHGNEAPR